MAPPQSCFYQVLQPAERPLAKDSALSLLRLISRSLFLLMEERGSQLELASLKREKITHKVSTSAPWRLCFSAVA